MIGPDHSVTTLRWSAGAQARIGIDQITVVAGFIALNDAIAATRWLTVVAGIGGIVVAIITALTGAHHTVAAACENAGG